MNKELELEAEEYANQINKNWFGMKLPEKNKDTKKDFIAGATSKYVEKQKLEFAIEQLKYIKMQCYTVRQFKADLLLDGKIRELEQQLKELENE